MAQRRREKDDELDPASKTLKWVIAVVVGGVATGLTHFFIDRARDRAQNTIASSGTPGTPPAYTSPAASPPPAGPAPSWPALPEASRPATTPQQPPVNPLPSIPAQPANPAPAKTEPPVAKAENAVYLASLTPFGYEKGPWKLGIGTTGDSADTPIKVKERPSRYGLGMHPPDHGSACRVSFAPNGYATRFKGWVALNDYSSDTFSPVRFVVYGDGRPLWESPDVTRKVDPVGFNIDVTGVKVLTLETKVTRGFHIGAHAVWFDPWLEK
jgi:hypothetical protein